MTSYTSLWANVMTRIQVTGVSIAALAVCSCATHPDDIQSTYVSPSLYARWTCEELVEERTRVASRVNQVTGLQSEAATGDAVFMTVGLVIFWPALLGLAATDDHEQELARLRGEYEAIDQSMTRNRCSLPSPSTTGASSPSGTDRSIEGLRQEANPRAATPEAEEIRATFETRIESLEANCTLEGGCQAAIDALTAERDRRLAALGE